MKFFIIFLLLIIFTPLPLKFSISINNKKYSIKLYNHTLLRKKNKKHKKINFKNVIKLLRSNKFKPIVHLSGSIYYDLKNPMFTSIIYGGIHFIINLSYIFINSIASIKKCKIDVIPKFNEEEFINLNIKCIVFSPIGQIIYILFIFYKNFKKVVKYD